VADITRHDGDETVQMAERGGGSAIFIYTDVTQSAQVESMVRETVRAYGRLDFAFNNAGVEGSGELTHLYPEEMWRRVIEIDLIGTWLCMKYELTHMLRQGSGAIVNTASIAGLVASPASGTAYTASKHGVVGLTKNAALEYAHHGIRINAVCPGPINTPMVQRIVARRPELEAQYSVNAPMRRMGTPEEVAEAVVWLCSGAASFITGQAVAIDGGYVAQ
jgi:NAD(P)-dependent dehydrogenase (short-subunit alcohol dehydrogenase family)